MAQHSEAKRAVKSFASKNDKFNLSRRYFKNIRAFIYGRNVKFFNKELQGKIKYENFINLNYALKKIFMILKKV